MNITIAEEVEDFSMLYQFQVFDSKFCDVRDRMQCYFANTLEYNQNRIWKATIDRNLRHGIDGMWGTIFSDLKDHEVEILRQNPFKPKLDAIYGMQLNNIKSMLVIPSDDAIQETADQWSNILLKIQEKDKFKDKSSEVFNSGLGTGMEALIFNIEFDHDLTNKIVSKQLSFNEFNIDNSFKNPDLSDCKYFHHWDYMTKEEVKYCFADYKDQIDDIICCGGNSNPMPPTGQIATLRVDKFWYLDYRKVSMVQDLISKKAFEWDGTSQELDFYLAQNPRLRVLPHIIPTIRLAISINNTIFLDEWNPLKLDRYPIALYMANFERSTMDDERTYGVIRNLIGSGFLSAQAQTLLWRHIQDLVYEKMLYKPTSLVNPKEAQMPGYPMGISLTEEASVGDVQPIRSRDITAQITNFIGAMNQQLQNTSGVNDAMTGTADDDDSGIKMLFKQGAGINIQAPLFKNMDIFMQNCGEIMYELARLHYSYDKIQTMLGQEPTREFYTKIFGNYRIEIVQGTNTTTQKVIQAKQLLELDKAGIPVDKLHIFDAYPLQGKSEIRKKVEANLQRQQEAEKQKAQVEQMKLEQAMQLKQAEINALNTAAQHNVAKSEERQTKAQENLSGITKNLATAEKDKSQEFLNVSKVLNDVKLKFEQLERIVERIERSVQPETGNYERNETQRQITPSQLLPRQQIAEGQIGEDLETIGTVGGEMLRSET